VSWSPAHALDAKYPAGHAEHPTHRGPPAALQLAENCPAAQPSWHATHVASLPVQFLNVSASGHPAHTVSAVTVAAPTNTCPAGHGLAGVQLAAPITALNVSIAHIEHVADDTDPPSGS
jgi:hypothetical protein